MHTPSLPQPGEFIRYHHRPRLTQAIIRWNEKHQQYRENRQEHRSENILTVREEFSIVLHDWRAFVPHLRR